MENIYAEITGDGKVGIHCDMETAELILEGLYRLAAEYPTPCPEEQKSEKRRINKLVQDIEGLRPQA